MILSGPGTVLDPDSNACVLEGTSSEPEETHDKCGPGTVYDEDANTCVLE